MLYRLKRLKYWHLRLICSMLIHLLTLEEHFLRMHWLRPWLLPDRRKTHTFIYEDRRRLFPPVAIYASSIFAAIIVMVIIHPPLGILLVIGFGALTSLYTIVGFTIILGRRLV